MGGDGRADLIPVLNGPLEQLTDLFRICVQEFPIHRRGHVGAKTGRRSQLEQRVDRGWTAQVGQLVPHQRDVFRPGEVSSNDREDQLVDEPPGSGRDATVGDDGVWQPVGDVGPSAQGFEMGADRFVGCIGARWSGGGNLFDQVTSVRARDVDALCDWVTAQPRVIEVSAPSAESAMPQSSVRSVSVSVWMTSL